MHKLIGVLCQAAPNSKGTVRRLTVFQGFSHDPGLALAAPRRWHLWSLNCLWMSRSALSSIGSPEWNWESQYSHMPIAMGVSFTILRRFWPVGDYPGDRVIRGSKCMLGLRLRQGNQDCDCLFRRHAANTTKGSTLL